MLVSQIKENDLTVELIDRLLFEGLEDTGESADCIIVLGSEKAVKYRAPVAIGAYKAGRAGKIMVCGGVMREVSDGKRSEAEEMYKAVREAGIPEKDIILEDSSQNTIENFLFALIELQRAFWLNRVKSVLLVTTAYHMRRSLSIARYLFPAHIRIIPCPANDINTRRENWMNTDAGTERAKREAINIVNCVNNEVFPDFDI